MKTVVFILDKNLLWNMNYGQIEYVYVKNSTHKF